MQEVPKLEVIATDDHTPVRCFLSEDKGSYVPYHYHPALEVIYVLQGSMQFAVMGDTAKRLEFLASESELKLKSSEHNTEHTAEVDFRIVKLPECSSIPALDAFTLRKVFGEAARVSNDQAYEAAIHSSHQANSARALNSNSELSSYTDYATSLNSDSEASQHSNSINALNSNSLDSKLLQEKDALSTKQINDTLSADQNKGEQDESYALKYKSKVDCATESKVEAATNSNVMSAANLKVDFVSNPKLDSATNVDIETVVSSALLQNQDEKSRQDRTTIILNQECANNLGSQEVESNHLRNRQLMPLERALAHNRINLVYTSIPKPKGTFNSPSTSVWSSDHLSRTLSFTANSAAHSQNSNSKVNATHLKAENNQTVEDVKVGQKVRNKYGASSLEELAYGLACSKRSKQVKQLAKEGYTPTQHNIENFSEGKDRKESSQQNIISISSQSLADSQSVFANSSVYLTQSKLSNQSVDFTRPKAFDSHFTVKPISTDSMQSADHKLAINSEESELIQYANPSLLANQETFARSKQLSTKQSLLSKHNVCSKSVQEQEHNLNCLNKHNKLAQTDGLKSESDLEHTIQEQFFMHNSYKSALTSSVRMHGKDQAMGSEYVQLDSGMNNCVLFNFDELHTTRCQNYNCSLVLQIPKYFLLESLGLEQTDSVCFVLSLASPQCLQRMQTALAKMAVLTLSGTSKQAIEGKEIRFKQALYSFLECLLEVKVNTAPLLHTESADFKMRSRIYPILDMLNSQYMQDISLNQVAEMLHVHPNYFCRIFKQVVGQSFYAYLTELRLCHIYQDLINSNEPLEDIVRRNGINLNTYFFSQFKRRFGITTSELRKRYTSNIKNKSALV